VDASCRRFREHPLPVVANGNAGSIRKSAPAVPPQLGMHAAIAVSRPPQRDALDLAAQIHSGFWDLRPQQKTVHQARPGPASRQCHSSLCHSQIPFPAKCAFPECLSLRGQSKVAVLAKVPATLFARRPCAFPYSDPPEHCCADC
jgi:hypothetical protein